MKTWLSLVWLAISFALPTFAQEKAAVDPETRQQIEDTYKRRLDAYNKHDAPAIAALFTEDAVFVNSTGFGDALSSGQEDIKKRYELDLASGTDVSGRILQVYAVGSEVCAISEVTVQRHQILHAVTVYVRDADEWKIRMYYLTR
jgi:uncharacterized protein (TIGR02246 family)